MITAEQKRKNREAQARYIAAHRDEIKAQQAAYRAAHREEINARQIARYHEQKAAGTLPRSRSKEAKAIQRALNHKGPKPFRPRDGGQRFVIGALTIQEANGNIESVGDLQGVAGTFAVNEAPDAIESLYEPADLPSRYLLALLKRDAVIWKRHHRVVIERGAAGEDEMMTPTEAGRTEHVAKPPEPWLSAEQRAAMRRRSKAAIAKRKAIPVRRPRHGPEVPGQRSGSRLSRGRTFAGHLYKSEPDHASGDSRANNADVNQQKKNNRKSNKIIAEPPA